MNLEFWKDWDKPWTQEQCQQRYVQGSRIGLRALAAEGDRSKKTVEDWCAAGKWVQERDRFQQNLQREIEQQTREKLAAELGEEYQQLNTEHFSSFKASRQLAALYFKMSARRLAYLQKIGSESELTAALENLSPVNANFWSLILDRAVRGERVASGLEYHDLNKAIDLLRQHGYEISDPTAQPTETQERQSITKGLTEEGAAILRAQILGIELGAVEDSRDLDALPDQMGAGQIAS